MCSSGFVRCQVDHCCYFKRFDKSYIILLLYVDDMLITGSNIEEIKRLKKLLSNQFEIKDLGVANKILSVRIHKDKANGTLKLSHAEYVKKVLKRFSMDGAKLVSTPLASHFRLTKEQSSKTEEEEAYIEHVPYASAIGSIMYAMVCTRPDIAHAVRVFCRYMSNPCKQHWEAVKWILKYLSGITDMTLCFRRTDIRLHGYVDADLAGDMDNRKSTTGYVYTLGGTAVSWISQLQQICGPFYTEAEYVAITEVGKEMTWLQNFLAELGKTQEMSILHNDSQSVIHLAKNPTFHFRTKHTQLRYHFIRSLVDDGVLSLEKIQGNKNPTDMLTKTVTIDKLKLAFKIDEGRSSCCGIPLCDEDDGELVLLGSKWEIIGSVDHDKYCLLNSTIHLNTGSNGGFGYFRNSHLLPCNPNSILINR